MQAPERNAAYLTGLQREKEHYHRCLCCRDTALIPGDVIARYSLVDPHKWHGDYDSTDDVESRSSKFYGSMAYLCTRHGCNANEIEVTALHEGRPYSKAVPRFADHSVSRLIDGKVCQWVHEKEVERLKSLKPKEFNVAAAAEVIGRNMPRGKNA